MPYTSRRIEFKNSKGQVAGRVGPTYLHADEAARMLLNAGFSVKENAVIALAVMKEESLLSPDAEGDLLIQDAEWGPSIGVMQIRSRKAEKGTGSQRDADVLRDPKRNIAEAKALFDTQGFRPWGAYSSGRYRKHLPWAEDVFQNLGSSTPRETPKDVRVPTAQDILKAAAKEIGYTESPSGSNRTKFAAEAGHANGQPWCATFIVAIARRCGLKLPSESAYTPSMAEGFKRIGRFDKTPKAGSIAFFDFPDSKYRIQHVGIVEGYAANHVTCIEGNTSSGPSGSQDNGGGVFRRVRSRGFVVGYGHPNYQEDWFAMASKADLEAVVNAAVKELRDELDVIKTGLFSEDTAEVKAATGRNTGSIASRAYEARNFAKQAAAQTAPPTA